MQYRVKALSFINGALQEPGAVVTLPDGVKPGKSLEEYKPRKGAADAEVSDDAEKSEPTKT